ncbi:similar to Saccharomyces cerevisiae YLR001C Putative protein of unknown function [Maudiozyma saulgeensis]|uniref:FAS1 domain-containing protein n=1 Tax=Maudiozyma saulgeensis TaxID=1789683 RepID=A0A1X7R5U8_9SACH|nr:similar to Saccharomyces cerevisiae YLR001C Putative protein of unknown function [Kazachstania saulgeensis]
MRHITILLFYIYGTIQLCLCKDIGRRQVSNDEISRSKDSEETPDFPFTTVIDILSSNVQFSTFLRLIQRSGNVNHLNDLQNFTLFAPVNSAFADYDDEFDISTFDINDYIFHNCILYTNDLINTTKIIYEGVNHPFVIGQSWDSMTKTNFKINKIPIVEPDLTPNFQNATVQGILNNLEKPLSLSEVIKEENYQLHDQLDIIFDDLNRLISRISESEKMVDGNTVIIPSDDSFERHLNSVELKYLLDSYNNLDRMQRPVREKWINHLESFFRNLIFKGIHGGFIDQSEVLTNLNNESILFDSNRVGTHHSSNITQDSLASNEIFRNGVAHFFEDTTILTNGVSFDAENYLHGLNCSGFVSEMYFRNIEDMIQSKEGIDEKMTIFVPEANQNDGMGFTKSTLLYHFMNEQIRLEEDFPVLSRGESFTKIFNSSFCSSGKKLGNNCQRVKITKRGDGYWINDKLKITVSKPYIIGNKLIYTFTGDLTPPGDLILSVPPFAHCSKSISFLRQLNLLELKQNHEGYTVFLPCFNSWGSISLTMDLIERDLSLMEQIMKNYILNGLYYTDMEDKLLETTNILGEKVKLKRIDDPDDSKNIELELDTMFDNITLSKTEDIFFNQGVLQPFQMTDLPKAVNISIKQLIGVTDSFEMISFLNKFGDLSHKLFHNSPHADLYSILIPTYSSLIFEDININSTKLENFLRLHILKGNETAGLINCSGEITTDLGQILECRKVSDTESFLKIKGGSDNEVRILKKGCSTARNNHADQRACVFLIDRPLSLSWTHRYNYHFSFPIMAIATGAVIGVLFIMSLFCCMVVLKVGKDPSHRHTDTNDEEQARDEHDPRRPLLSVPGNNVRSYTNQHRMVRTPTSFNGATSKSNDSPSNSSTIPTHCSKSAAQAYSANSTATPINVSPRN